MTLVPHIGDFASGPRASISDVAGVTVGHSTIATGPLQTGVTVVRPHLADPYWTLHAAVQLGDRDVRTACRVGTFSLRAHQLAAS